MTAVNPRPSARSNASVVPPALAVAAVSRLLAHAPGNPRDAARRFLATAANHGIDPALMWATWDDQGQPREVCLAVCGSGRTATMFLAPPDPSHSQTEVDRLGADQARAEAIRAALAGLRQLGSDRVVLAQALASPEEPWAVRAFQEAGFLGVGRLVYLRRPLGLSGGPSLPDWPPGVSLASLATFGGVERWRQRLEHLLDATYEQTLDCPALCGLRKTSDVLASHLAVGRFDARHWNVLCEGDEWIGCILLTRLPEMRSVELVYFGLTPKARGRGLGKALLQHGLRNIARLDADEVTCAVDQGNAPAIRLYRSANFTDFGSRHAFVAPLEKPVDESAGR